MWPVLGVAAVLYCAVTCLLPAAQLILQLDWENLGGTKFKKLQGHFCMALMCRTTSQNLGTAAAENAAGQAVSHQMCEDPEVLVQLVVALIYRWCGQMMMHRRSAGQTSGQGRASSYSPRAIRA